MAKGKTARASKSQPAAEAKRKAPPRAGRASKEAIKNTADKNAAETTPEFTGIAIGHAAGEVWGVLSGGEPRTIADVKKSVKAPADVVVAAIGWLAREDKLEFITNGKSVKIGLR